MSGAESEVSRLLREGETAGTTGNFAKAEDFFRRAMDRGQKRFGSSSAEYANIQVAVGSFYLEAGKQKEASEHFSKALAIDAREASLITSRLVALNGLGLIASFEGRTEDALNSLRRAVGLAYSAPSVSPDLLGAILHNYAGTLLLGEEIHEARVFAQQSLEIRRNALGPDSLPTGQSLALLGEIDYKAGNIEKAKEELDGSLQILTSSKGNQYASINRVLLLKGKLLVDTKEFENAADSLGKALLISEKLYGARSHQASDAAYQLGLAKLALNQPEKASELFERSLATMDVKTPAFLNAKIKLANSLASLGRHSESISHLESALKASDSISKVEELKLQILNHLLAEYDATNDTVGKAETERRLNTFRAGLK